ncbi:MAG: O-antigen ligase family protein, partial [Candidatus Pacearchaeota archaeon]
ALIPLLYIPTLYFPFVSGKIYIFRFLLFITFFFWVWLKIEEKRIIKIEFKRKPLENGKKAGLFKDILVLAIFSFFLTQFFAAIFGIDPFFSFFSGFERADGVLQYGFWLLYFVMLVSTFKERKDWEFFFKFFVVSAVLSSTYAWLNFGKNQYQLFGVFGNPAYFGGYLIFAIGFSFFAFRNWRLSLGVASFLALTLFFTQIRGVIIGLFGGVTLFSILYFWFLRKENKKLAYSLVAILIISVALFSILILTADTSFVRNNSVLKRISEIGRPFESSSFTERYYNWQIALKAFKERPLFGYGPWNFGSALNKYYDWRVARNEPWFDHPHNQVLGVLAGSGIVGFLSYLFLVGAIFISIYKISRKDKTIAIILWGILIGYLLQSLFLFDILPVYIGYFPFLAYLFFLKRDLFYNLPLKKPLFGFVKFSPYLIPTLFISLFLVYFTVFMPWKANHFALEARNFIKNGLYKEAIPYLQKSFAINSPYTKWEARGFSAQDFYDALWSFDKEKDGEKIAEIGALYDFMAPELEKFAKDREWYPQTYFLVPTIYRLGYEKLGRDDLEKAKKHLEKSFEKSSLRVEYYNNYAKILLLQGKVQEVEEFYREYINRFPKEWGAELPYIFLGNFYHEAKKHNLALEQYDKALEAGYAIEKDPETYLRYMLSSEQIKDYRRIVEMGKRYLDYLGPKADADSYYNVAVGYFNLGDKENAKNYFLKALELKPEEYEKHKKFFLE